MSIPSYPEFVSVTLDLKDEMSRSLFLAGDGVSEFSFCGFYLFRNRYHYRVSRLADNSFVFSGVQPPRETTDASRAFFMTPAAMPEREVLEELFKTHDYWKNIPDSIAGPQGDRLAEWGVEIAEDRDNFDYLYLRSDLAELKGKKFHKKRNLVAQFNSAYSAEEAPLSRELVPQAKEVLEGWKEDKGASGDYDAALEALERFDELGASGSVIFIDKKPVAWCLGEPIARGSIYTVHFEKALDEYKGIFQYLNQTFAASLPETVSHINREQDLGDDGLRQAKMSYRPSGFVRKHIGTKRS